MDLHRFFRQTLPQFICGRLEEFLLLQGSLSFIVPDKGAWSVRLGNADEPVVEGSRGDADLTITATEEALSRFLDGTLDTATAVRAGEITYKGDLRVLERFGRILAGGASPLAVRVAARKHR